MSSKSLNDYQKMILEINQANGWFDSSRTFGDDVALLHSEASEMFEAFRDDGLDDVTQRDCKYCSDPYSDYEHICKPQGVGSEAADVLVRLLDTCERYDIDIEAELERKIAYNATRGYRHGNKKV